MTLCTTIEIPVVVDYVASPGEKEVRFYRNGDGHPGSDPEATVLSVKFFGEEILHLLTQEDVSDLESLCLEHALDIDPDPGL